MNPLVLGSLIGGGLSFLGANRQANAAESAGNLQAQAAANASALQAEQTRPWREAGTMALSELVSPEGLNAMTRSFTMDDFQADPGYQFRFDQGQQALERSRAARGMFNSGNTLQDLIEYGQGMGSQEYGAAYNRFNSNQAKLANYLQSLAGQGQTSSQNYATNAGTNMMTGAQGIGNAGMVGAAGYNSALQGIAGMTGNVMGSPEGMSWLNNLFKPAPTVSGGGLQVPSESIGATDGVGLRVPNNYGW